MNRPRAGAAALAAVVLGALAAMLPSAAVPATGAKVPAAAAALKINVLSNRADLISGGDALVAVRLAAGTNPARSVAMQTHSAMRSMTGIGRPARIGSCKITPSVRRKTIIQVMRSSGRTDRAKRATKV